MSGISNRILAVLCGLALSASAAVDQCKPIGWATRSGRTSTEFNVTGGGNSTPITVKTFADLQKYAKDSSPRVIYIDGTLGDGWSGTTGSRLNITASNKTIIGLKPGTLLKAPIHITSKASNIIIRNIVIQGPGSNADQAWDNLTIEGESKNIWIDHCEFWDGQDGNADVVKGSDNVTFTWCIFGYKKKSTHNLSNLIGSSDNEPVSEGKLNVTYMFNWWKAANQRKPRCRYGNVHVVNNLLTGDASITNGTDVLGVAAGHMCRVRTERNVFINENNPIYTGVANGTGVNEVIDNIFTNCSGNTKGTGTSFTPPYEYTSFMLKASEVEAAVKANAGATLKSPTECDANYVEPEPPTPDKQYQAEKGTITGGVSESSNGGYHGDGYVNFDKGGDVVVKVKVDTAGQYKLIIDFANGSNEARSLAISAGLDTATTSFKTTGGWTVWETAEVLVNLAAGENAVKFATVGGNDGPNIDQFNVTLVKAVEKDSSEEKTTSIRSKLVAMVEPSVYRVSIFDTKGSLVRRMNVESAKVGDVARMTRGLPAGLYVMQLKSANTERRKFITVK
ncbi:carbohydrate-binding protein [Fibrobacter sp. UBA4297]|uniref:pectate lyase family protein n=1 Tax=Fibrobacter sp. UBA4297 TaxID=1946536 RepID=UPI0025BEF69F|nr:carbohydrate-binding protein [Fibrobacter sp. UBA4297]